MKLYWVRRAGLLFFIYFFVKNWILKQEKRQKYILKLLSDFSSYVLLHKFMLWIQLRLNTNIRNLFETAVTSKLREIGQFFGHFWKACSLNVQLTTNGLNGLFWRSEEKL